MNYLSVRDLSKTVREKPLFSELFMGLEYGDKAALIANNGSGKSTLMRIIAGGDTPDRGEVVFKDGIRVGYLPQEPHFPGANIVADLVQGEQSAVLQLIRRYENAVNNHSINQSDANTKELEDAAQEMDHRNAWDYERRLQEMMHRFGITELQQSIDSLSGGQRKRLALALLLLDSPEILLLDEPTNHLDIEMIEWLEKYLGAADITLLMVTHDRYFLDRICNHIYELHDGKMYHHKGNYAYFLQKREEREEVFRIEAEKAGQQLKKELEWMRRMPKARTTKSKARIDAYYELEKKAGYKQQQHNLQLEVKMSRVGGKVLEMKKVYKKYGEKIMLQGFDYTFRKGERIGILGKNGVGKSTFLNMITGKEQPDSGKLQVGDTIVFGYYTQQGLQVSDDKRVIEVLKDVADVIEMADGSKITAAQLLTLFMFNYDMQYTPVGKLSGGERRRLHLLMTLMKNPNFLILDEPTNDLDLLTLQKLEDFLEHYGGCLLIVSHDRYFMDQLVEHLFVFEGNGIIRDFWGNYSDFKEKELEELRAKQKAEALKNIPTQTKKSEPVQTSGKTKLSYKEQKEYELLEAEIQALETEKSTLEQALGNTELTFDAVASHSHRIGEVVQLIEEKTMRWLELSERA